MITQEDLKNKTLAEKLILLREMTVDSLILGISDGTISPINLQNAITILNQNKVTEERPPEKTELEQMDDLVSEVLNSEV